MMNNTNNQNLWIDPYTNIMRFFASLSRNFFFQACKLPNIIYISTYKPRRHQSRLFNSISFHSFQSHVPSTWVLLSQTHLLPLADWPVCRFMATRPFFDPLHCCSSGLHFQLGQRCFHRLSISRWSPISICQKITGKHEPIK